MVVRVQDADAKVTLDLCPLACTPIDLSVFPCLAEVMKQPVADLSCNAEVLTVAGFQ